MIETEQAAVAIATAVKFLIEASKDGISLTDGSAFVTKLIADVQFRTVFMEGLTGISKIPAEVKAEFASPNLEDILSVVVKVANVFKKAV